MAFPYSNRFENVEVIRVKAKKCDGLMQPEYKKFCIDPQITSFEMLQNLLARAFSIVTDFTISYLIREDDGHTTYLSLLSDWDMDAAFQTASEPCLKLGLSSCVTDFTISYLIREDDGHTTYLSLLSDWDMDAAFQTASEPCLKLKVDLKPFEEGLEDWDVIAPLDIPSNRFGSFFEKGSMLMSLSDTISSRVERTMSQVNKAIGRKRSESSRSYKPLKLPMSDAEFLTYLDAEGRLIRPQEFRLSIYQGGVEPSLRRVAWRHLLNVFPPCLTGKERFDYMKERERQYYSLRDDWKKVFNREDCPDHLKYVTSLVKKDVLRTDRAHPFYAGSDDNKNVVSLFHILVTYAITHPSVSYCQGMSDIASPLLVVQKDEGQAYICFCAVMHRLHRNFLLDGVAMTIKFQHLTDLLKYQIPAFFQYLIQHNAQDVFFCYRWLLLETKREFPLDNALYMLEVMWSTLPPAPSDYEVTLTDRDYYTSSLTSLTSSPPFSSKQTVYTKFLTRHRQNSFHRSSLSTSLDEQLAGNSMNNNTRVCDCDCSPIYEESFSAESSTDFSTAEITQSLQRRSTEIDKSLKFDSVSSTSSCDEQANSLSASSSCNSSVGSDVLPEHPKTCVQCGKFTSHADLKTSQISHDGNDDHDDGHHGDQCYVDLSHINCTDADNLDVKHRQIPCNANKASCVNGNDNHTSHKRYSTDSLSKSNRSMWENSEKKSYQPKFQFYQKNDNLNSLARNSITEDSHCMTEEKTHSNVGLTNQNSELENSVFDEPCFHENTQPGNLNQNVVENSQIENSHFNDQHPNETTPTQENSHFNDHNFNPNRQTENHNSNAPHLTGNSFADNNFSEHCNKASPMENSDLKQNSNLKNSDLKQNSNMENSDLKQNSSLESSVLKQNSNMESSDLKQNSLENSDLKSMENSDLKSNKPTSTSDTTTTDDETTSTTDDQDSFFDDSINVLHTNIPISLPPPHDFGAGNPFLMFISLAMFLQHHDHITRNYLDYDEMAMHFDKMVRKHQVDRVLHHARLLYCDYLREQQRLVTEQNEQEESL